MCGRIFGFALVSVGVFLVGCVGGRGWYVDGETGIRYDYKTLVGQAKMRDTTVNFTALRFSYTHTKAFDPYDFNGEGFDEMMWKAFSEASYDKAVAWAAKILDKDYTDIDAHLVSEVSYEELGDTVLSWHHSWIAFGLIESILTSGDGQSTESAFVVIDISEEYSVFRVLGWERRQQSLLESEGGGYDAWEVYDPDGDSTFMVFFNIDIPLNNLTRRL